MAYKLYTLPAVTIASINTPTAITNNEGLAAASLIITAKHSNTQPMYIGGSDVTASSGERLDPGDSLQIGSDTIKGSTHEIYLNSIYAFSDTLGTGVTIQYLKLK